MSNLSRGPATLAGGEASVDYTIGLPAGPYTIRADYVPGVATFAASFGTNTLTVSREDAAVSASASNPGEVLVDEPGGAAGPVTLCADVSEPADGSAGNTSNAVPVSFTLTPVVGGGILAQNASSFSGGGPGGTLVACAVLPTVPVNVFTVDIAVGGVYYSGTSDDVLAVCDPALGSVIGVGRVINPNTGAVASFGISVKYLKKNNVQGSFLYLEHAPRGAGTRLKVPSLRSLSIVGGSAVVLERNAALGGVGGYDAKVTLVDNGEPGSSDAFGLEVKAPNGKPVAQLTFGPVNLIGGNIQVGQKGTK
jgi:hypothetical protein